MRISDWSSDVCSSDLVADQRAIQNTPKWTLSGTLDAAAPLASGMVNASTTLSYRSGTNQFETPNPFPAQPGSALWDARLVWTSDRQTWPLGLHPTNHTATPSRTPPLRPTAYPPPPPPPPP